MNITELKKLLTKYKQWQKELKADLIKFEDETSIEQSGELYCLTKVIKDLQKLLHNTKTAQV